MLKIKELKSLTSNLSVLYVEDDDEIRIQMSKYFEKLFASVTSAKDGLEGFEYFQKDSFDVVVTDLSMPHMNGISMIKKIREIDEKQNILITTAHKESDYLMGAIVAHVDGYILKPFDYDSLNFELFKTAQRIIQFKQNEEYKKNLQAMVAKKTAEIKENYEKTLYSMVELVEKRDTYTAGHSKRVAKYSSLIAKEMGYSNEECTLIYQAGILHDIGKIETPDSVLLNPKRLNDIEYKLIQEHVIVGYSLLEGIPMFKPMAKIVYSHHEKYDGSGYPNGLKGDEIDKLARIMIVADSFDAMTTNRIYKSRKSKDVAINELITLSGKHYDPEVVKKAINVLKNVEIDTNINQLPHTKLEKERFSYFYNDTISQAYNQSYLELILIKNSYENNFSNMIIFSIKNFSSYNKEFGWSSGDKLLKEFGDTLTNYFNESLVFRVFGDDFVVISKDTNNISEVIEILDKFVQNKVISYTIKNIDLEKTELITLNDLEDIQQES
jgi:putative nucleotidyltransferase with HDIG domain/diguanylate cyclase (GGDEF)-like protein